MHADTIIMMCIRKNRLHIQVYCFYCLLFYFLDSATPRPTNAPNPTAAAPPMIAMPIIPSVNTKKTIKKSPT